MLKKYNNLHKVMFLLLFVMLIAVLASIVVLKNKSILIYMYSFAFLAQLIILFTNINIKKIVVDKQSMILMATFMLIMSLPCICNIFLGINTNIYDYINIFFKGFYFFLFYCVFKNAYINENQLKKFMKGIVIIGVISCLYNFIFCYDEIFKIFKATSSYQVNIMSFFTNRNDFGGFLSLSVIATYYLYGNSKNKKEKIKKYILLLIFIINIFITFSRGAIFTVGLLIAYMLFEKYKNNPKIIIYVIIGLLTLIFISSNMKVVNFLEAFVVRSDNFDSNRFNLWDYGLKIIKENPIFGVGYYTGLDIAISNNFPNTQFHNFFIDTTVATGLIGTIFLFFIVVSCLIRCMKKCEYKYYKKLYLISFITLLMKMLIESVSFFSIGYSDNVASIFFIALPLLFSNMKKEDNNE